MRLGRVAKLTILGAEAITFFLLPRPGLLVPSGGQIWKFEAVKAGRHAHSA